MIYIPNNKRNSNSIKIVFLFFLFILLFIFCFLNYSAQASAVSGWEFSQKNKDQQESKNSTDSFLLKNSDYFIRTNLPFLDDITKDQKINGIILTGRQKHEALVWDLTYEQEKRFLLLMKNRSGFYYKNSHLTPVEILGINARTDQERTELAKLAAMQEFQKMGKFLAFASAYNKEALDLKDRLKLPILRKFDYSRFSPYSYRPISFQDHDQFMLFINSAENVKPIVSYLMGAVLKNKTLKLDIYFIDQFKNKKSGEIQKIITKWAKGQSIPTELTKEGRITLNADTKKYAELNNTRKQKSEKEKETPLLILVRDGQKQIIDTGMI